MAVTFTRTKRKGRPALLFRNPKGYPYLYAWKNYSGHGWHLLMYSDHEEDGTMLVTSLDDHIAVLEALKAHDG